MEIDIRKIKKIIELLENSSVSEIEMKEGEVSLRLSRHSARSVTPALYSHQMEPFSSPQSSAPGPSPLEPSRTEPQSSPPAIQGHIIRSPMVGTFYSASSPDAASFVNIGQSIRAGEVLCIIEAMKMFNEIEADRAGVVIDVLVKNGDPVEYDQPLFIIE